LSRESWIWRWVVAPFLKLYHWRDEGKNLESLFRDGDVPSADQLAESWRVPSEWWVSMLSGLPSLRRLGHRKQLRHVGMGSEVVGCNILFKDLRWGHFRLESGASPLDGRPVLLVNYQVPGNRFPLNRIRDHVRTTVDPWRMIGRFHLRLFGRDRGVGYFELRRKR
jgi:hypothetical protein